MDADYVELFSFMALMWAGGFTLSLKILSFKKFSEVVS